MSRPSENGSNSNNDPSTDLASLITQVGTTWGVKSHPSEPYFRVFIDINNVITSCDCLSFMSTRIPCIHMCMLKWYNKGIILAHTNQPVHVAPHFLPPHQQPMQQAPPPMQHMPQPMQQQHPVQQTQPLPQQPPQQSPQQPPQQSPQQPPQQSPQQPPKQSPPNRAPIQPKSASTSSMAAPILRQARSQPLPPPTKRGRPRNETAPLVKRICNQTTQVSTLPKAPTRPTQPAAPTKKQPLNVPASRPINPFAPLSSGAPRAPPVPPVPPPVLQRASPLQQSSPLQSPTSSAIQQQLQLQLTRHLQQQRPSVQAKKTQKQPELTKDIDKLVTLLTELNKKYETIKPSSSTSPPSLPPNIDSDIALRGKKIALEAQSAMRMGLGGEKLQKFILDMLEKERKDIATKPSFSSSSSSSAAAAAAAAATVNVAPPSTSNAPPVSTAPAKPAATTAAAATASSPISISSGPSTPTVSSPLAQGAASSPARKGFKREDNAVVVPSPRSPAVKPPSTAIPPATPPSTLSPIASPPKAAAASTANANTSSANANTSSATASTSSATANTSTATANTPTATASVISASSSPAASSSSVATGRKRRELPAFARSPFLQAKQELRLPEKKYVKREGCSSQRKPYPVVEPIEGYDAAIARMIERMNNEKNSASDPWSISSSSEDEDDDGDD
ncbi:hypothetical protein MBANPS3_009211 [Mucor bainieri]